VNVDTDIGSFTPDSSSLSSLNDVESNSSNNLIHENDPFYPAYGGGAYYARVWRFLECTWVMSAECVIYVCALHLARQGACDELLLFSPTPSGFSHSNSTSLLEGVASKYYRAVMALEHLLFESRYHCSWSSSWSLRGNSGQLGINNGADYIGHLSAMQESRDQQVLSGLVRMLRVRHARVMSLLKVNN